MRHEPQITAATRSFAVYNADQGPEAVEVVEAASFEDAVCAFLEVRPCEGEELVAVIREIDTAAELCLRLHLA